MSIRSGHYWAMSSGKHYYNIQHWTPHIFSPFDAHCCHMGTAAIKHPNPHQVKPSSMHSDARGRALECPDVKNCKLRLNPVWHRMLYSCCTHMATVGVKGFNVLYGRSSVWKLLTVEFSLLSLYWINILGQLFTPHITHQLRNIRPWPNRSTKKTTTGARCSKHRVASVCLQCI